MYVKIHSSATSQVISICDEDLIGKTFKSKELTLKVSESFYKGEILPEEKILQLLKTANNVNIVGKKSVDFAIKHKIISKENIILIENVPHAQVFS